MTLNDHFALKSVLGLPRHGFACSSFRTKLFGNMQSYADTVSNRNVAERYKLYAVIRLGSMKRGRQTGELHSQPLGFTGLTSAVLFTEVYKISNEISKSLLLFIVAKQVRCQT